MRVRGFVRSGGGLLVLWHVRRLCLGGRLQPEAGGPCLPSHCTPQRPSRHPSQARPSAAFPGPCPSPSPSSFWYPGTSPAQGRGHPTLAMASVSSVCPFRGLTRGFWWATPVLSPARDGVVACEGGRGGGSRWSPDGPRSPSGTRVPVLHVQDRSRTWHWTPHNPMRPPLSARRAGPGRPHHGGAQRARMRVFAVPRARRARHPTRHAVPWEAWLASNPRCCLISEAGITSSAFLTSTSTPHPPASQPRCPSHGALLDSVNHGWGRLIAPFWTAQTACACPLAALC